MNMNDEKYILARLKAAVIEEIRKPHDYSWEKDNWYMVLQLIAKFEAEAILGDILEEGK